MEALVAAGADAHIRNGKGWAAVHSAAAAGQLEVVLRLVAAGAAPRARPELDVLRLLTRKTSYKWDPDSALSQQPCPSCITPCRPFSSQHACLCSAYVCRQCICLQAVHWPHLDNRLHCAYEVLSLLQEVLAKNM